MALVPREIAPASSSRSRWRRLARLFVLIASLSLAAAAAPAVASAERVTATLTFNDGNGTQAPIRRATVEIWRKYGSFIPIWHNDFTVTTDEQGRIDTTVPTVGAGSAYGLRVYAINPAAIVRFTDRPQDAFYEQPGPGAGTQLVSNGASDVLDFSWNFTDPGAAGGYNIADALLDGRDYALARRAPGETEPIDPLNVILQNSNTFYDSYIGAMRLNPALAMDDRTILHEYAHALENKLSSFQALASVHDGCNVQLGQGGAHAESPGMAWMEGFADYFARAVALAFGSKISGPGLGTTSLATLESPSCPGSTLPHDWLEDFVAGALWDIVDPANEPGDRLCDSGQGMANTIFSIFDRELQRRNPTLQGFFDAWVARGLDVPALTAAFSAQGVNLTTPPVLQYYSPTRAADLAVWRASESGAWYILGRSGPNWGVSGDVPVPADYDGDGFTDAGVWRPSTGEWFVLLSASEGVSQVTQWGAPTDIPLPADYDGDGEVDYAVYRPSQQAVLVQNDSCGSAQTIPLPGAGTPVVGDVDGDRAADPGLYNPATGNMTMRTRALSSMHGVQWSTLATDARPAIADYDADGKDDLATYTPKLKGFHGMSPPGGIWTIAKSRTNTINTETWGGMVGDLAVPADYDGDGNADLAVWNTASGNWTIRRADGTGRTVQWGAPGDIPIPR